MFLFLPFLSFKNTKLSRNDQIILLVADFGAALYQKPIFSLFHLYFFSLIFFQFNVINSKSLSRTYARQTGSCTCISNAETTKHTKAKEIKTQTKGNQSPHIFLIFSFQNIIQTQMKNSPLLISSCLQTARAKFDTDCFV